MIIKTFPVTRSRQSSINIINYKEIFATIKQCEYIFGNNISMPTSGSIILLNMKKYNSVLIAYMDNFKGQITLAHLIHGNMTMNHYIRFVNELISSNLITSLTDPRKLSDQLEPVSYYRLYTPKNFNRD